jgi:hypothetical protein
MSSSGDAGFDQWLSSQLEQHASAHAGPSPMPAQAQYHATYVNAGTRLPLLAKVAAALTTKTAIAVAAGALAIGAAGVGESVITGSTNPGDWGKQVVKQVNECKAALAPGSHGIGQCVSSFASQHGAAKSAEHRATPTPAYGDHTPGQPPGKGKANPHPTPHPHSTPPKKNK